MFDYQPSRAGIHARTFLDGWKGHLMVDDYSGYKKTFGENVKELACLAHIRRKFYDLFVANKSPIAEEALRRIEKLYKIESEGKEMDAPARLALRQRDAKPLLEDFLAWLDDTRQAVAKGSGAETAVLYAWWRQKAPAALRGVWHPARG